MWIKLLGNAIQIAVTFTLELVNDPYPHFLAKCNYPNLDKVKIAENDVTNTKILFHYL